jgi:hypothetical protein
MSPADTRYVACRSCGRTCLAQRVTCPYCGTSLRVQARPPAPSKVAPRAPAPRPSPPANATVPRPTPAGPRYDRPAPPPPSAPYARPPLSAGLGTTQDVPAAVQAPFSFFDNETPAPPSDLPAPRRGHRWKLAGALGAVAVAAIVVVVIVLHLPVTSGDRAAVSYGTPIPFSEAIGPARSDQASAIGAPWTVVAVVGIGSDQSIGGQSAAGSQVSGCTTLWANASGALAPATPSNASAGDVSLWAVASENQSGDVLLTLVTASSSVVSTYNGIIVTGSCTSKFDGGGAIPTKVVDTPAVVTSANIAGGSKFLSSYPVNTVDLTLLNPYWVVEYSTCPTYATSGTGTEWVAIEYASNGTQVVTPGSGPASC